MGALVEWLIASGRDLGEINLEGKEDGEDYRALEIARAMEHQEVEVLPERFIAKSGQTLHELRVKLGVLEAGFALTVFLCDYLLLTLLLRPPGSFRLLPSCSWAADDSSHNPSKNKEKITAAPSFCFACPLDLKYNNKKK